ncbi:MAG: ABC transporter permease [Pseudomonadales bacterium]|jgi:lipopolysaccharide transport system permease protein|nr:ABC transporter permease [Pseudomonadales bacterium]MDP6473017.1 ABC transporter permease [Pseudomonadales bacterium]MDP6826226.1 ABC transporter permease [Pseudomonadales bacterium]
MSGTTTNRETHKHPVVHIQSTKGMAPISFAELWAYREVIFYLTWRDVKVRYKQTIFGASWAIMQPLLTMVIFSIIFGRVAKIPSDGIPYPIFSYAALLPWTFFASSVTKASNSLVGGGGMVKQIYFPRLAIPLSSMMSGAVDFVLAFSVLVVMMMYYGIVPTLNVIWLPALLLLTVITALGVSLVLTAMNVQFRDVKHAIGFLIQAWMYATPVVYPLSVIEDPLWKLVYALNPMVGVVEGFRWALLGTQTAPGEYILISAAMAVVLFVFGLYYFKRMERTFADVM